MKKSFITSGPDSREQLNMDQNDLWKVDHKQDWYLLSISSVLVVLSCISCL